MKLDILLLIAAFASLGSALWLFWNIRITELTVKLMLLLICTGLAAIVWWGLR